MSLSIGLELVQSRFSAEERFTKWTGVADVFTGIYTEGEEAEETAWR